MLDRERFFQRVKDVEDCVKRQEEVLKDTASRYADGEAALSDLKHDIDIYERTEASLSTLESTLFELQIFPEYRGWEDEHRVHRTQNAGG